MSLELLPSQLLSLLARRLHSQTGEHLLALLPWRFTTVTALPAYLHFIDVMIGFTFAFHICTWIRQVRLSQSDISGPGPVKSLLCIAVFQIISLCLVAMTPSSGVSLAIQRVFVDFPDKVLDILTL